jgi:hypothetical protein
MRSIIFCLLLLLSLKASSQVRYYFSSSQYAPIAPSIQNNWTSINQGDYFRLTKAKDGSTLTVINTSASVSNAENSSGDFRPLRRMYISEPLAAQTISMQSITLNFRAAVNTIGSTTLNIAFNFSIESPSGVVRAGSSSSGTWATTNDGTLSTTMKNMYRVLTYGAGNTVTVQCGDRMVLELGFYYWTGTGQGSRTLSMEFGNSNGTDLAANNTDTTQGDPWFEITGPTSISYCPERRPTVIQTK